MKRKYYILPVLFLCMTLVFVPVSPVHAVSSSFRSSLEDLVTSIQAGTYDKGTEITDIETAKKVLGPMFTEQLSFYHGIEPGFMDDICGVYFDDCDRTVSGSAFSIFRMNSEDCIEFFSGRFESTSNGYVPLYSSPTMVNSFFYNKEKNVLYFKESFFESDMNTGKIINISNSFYIVNNVNSFAVYRVSYRDGVLQNKESYIKNFYYELPDGRSSENVSKEEILALYSPVPEDPDPSGNPGLQPDMLDMMNTYLAFSVSILTAIAKNPIMSFILACPLICICIYVLQQIKRASSDTR